MDRRWFYRETRSHNFVLFFSSIICEVIISSELLANIYNHTRPAPFPEPRKTSVSTDPRSGWNAGGPFRVSANQPSGTAPQKNFEKRKPRRPQQPNQTNQTNQLTDRPTDRKKKWRSKRRPHPPPNVVFRSFGETNNANCGWVIIIMMMMMMMMIWIYW